MRVPLLNFEGSPRVLLLNFEGGPAAPLLNFERGPGSRGPVPTSTPCQPVRSLVPPPIFEELDNLL